MRTSLIALSISIVTSGAFAGAGGNIGLRDDRHYGSLQDPLYSAVGRLSIGCTVGFIHPHLFITNKHCFAACPSAKPCTVNFWDGETYQNSAAKAIRVPRPESDNYLTDGTDWVIYQTEIPNPNVKTIASRTTLGPVDRGGFGLLRVIEDHEIPELKRIYTQVTRERTAECNAKHKNDQNKALACIHSYVTKELNQRGIKPLFNDGKNFKVQKCNIHTFINDYIVRTDCDSAGGDSGAPLLRGNTIVAINNSGPQTVFGKNENHGAAAVQTSNFYEPAMQAIKTLNIAPIPIPSPAPAPTPSPTPSPTEPTPSSTEPGGTTTPAEPVASDPTTIEEMRIKFIQDFECD